MKILRRNKGFTLIELLLVVVIIGLLLAVIVPRAWRANIDSKYGLVRQNCAELASWGHLWAENQIEASVEFSTTATMYNYLRSLCSGSAGDPPASMWVARNAANNWRLNVAFIDIQGRTPTTPEAKVEDVVPPEKIPRNPFNGSSVFVNANDPVTTGNVIPGAIACGVDVDPSRNPVGSWAYFAFVFQGTDSTNNALNNVATWHAGMHDQEIQGLRNGIFFAREGVFANPQPAPAP